MTLGWARASQEPGDPSRRLERNEAQLAAAAREARQLRISLRSTRDEARPVRLLQMMLAGERFSELDSRGHAADVWLELSRDQARLHSRRRV